jgi:serine/threonine protein kinase
VGSTQEAVLPVGHVFAGRYRIKSFLGEGDRKRTYLADDTVFPREVALALIKQDAALSDPEGTRREAEALALAGRNDNVVTFHDSGTAEGTEYLVFDYLSGGDPARISREARGNRQAVVDRGGRAARAAAGTGLGIRA